MEYWERNSRSGQNREVQLLESKHMDPGRFGDNKGSTWKVWKREVVEYVQYKMPDLAIAMEKIASTNVPIAHADVDALQVDRRHDSQLRSFLANKCTKGTTAGDLVDNQIGETGLEVWRVLSSYFDPMVEHRKLEKVLNIMSPGKATTLERLGEMIPAWENSYEDAKRRTGEAIPETWRSGILYKMMPRSLQCRHGS